MRLYPVLLVVVPITFLDLLLIRSIGGVADCMEVVRLADRISKEELHGSNVSPPAGVNSKTIGHQPNIELFIP